MFEFKQFTIDDSNCSMKVGTDAVLLGALANPLSFPDKILDIGTGCGVIALMMAQRFNSATVLAIDIDSTSCEVCSRNFESSPFGNKLEVSNTALQDFKQEGFDLIVSNPPYFENSLKAPNQQRSLARHTDSLSFNELINHSKRLLNNKGELWIIIPTNVANKIIKYGCQTELFPRIKIDIKNNPNKESKRSIIGFCQNKDISPIEEQHYIRDSDNKYSSWYREITCAFYTHLK